jgi:CheY-like chemotaxis protein
MTNLIKKLRLENESYQELALIRTKEISELKSYFMSNMSHELRTPINAILGIVQSNLDTNDPEVKEQYQTIKNASLSLLSNVNDILDFEKIESNQLRLNNNKFSPKQLITDISNNWKVEANKKGLNYIFNIDSEIPETVEGDPERFIQIINNVLSNAVKFTLEGTIVFKLKCLSQPNGFNRFSIQISDTGIGMTEEVKNNVFNSFNQMRNNHKRQFGGIGLGLNIVENLVTLFEGTISIESKLNKGTKVYIDIPLQVVEAEAHVQKEQQPSQEKSIQILVVEDNRLNQMVMKKLLSANLSFNFTIVENGKEALDELNYNAYDLVLMDLQMPIMDGYEATKAIREGKTSTLNKDIAIIAVTADAMPKTKDRVLEIGMNDYMTKPIDKNELFDKINQFSIKPKLKIA